MEKRNYYVCVASIGILLCCCGSKDAAKNLDLVGKETEETPQNAIAKPKSGRLNQDDGPGKGLGVDLIMDLIFRKNRDGWTLTTPNAHVNVDKLRKSQVDLFFSAIPMNSGAQTFADLERSLKINEELIAQTSGRVALVSSFQQALENRDKGVISAMVYLEGADALQGHTDSLGLLRQKGVGVVGLVAGRKNQFADAAQDRREPGGVTEEGYDLLEKCRDFRVIVDLTHASQATFWDALVVQAGNVMVNHSAAKALREHPRNLDDLQILALARYGGVFGLVFNPDFLKIAPESGADIADVVRHVMYIKSIGAMDALALGTDYGGIHPPRGLDDVSRLPALFDALKQQGLSDREIDGIRGENAARLFNEIERKRGAIRLTQSDILRPLALECESVTGEFQGSPSLACDRYLSTRGATVEATGRQRFRLQDMAKLPARLEVFGQPSTPWQVVGQNLSGKVLFTRMLALDKNGNATLSLPSRRNLTRIFLSPTRQSYLEEVVVWGK